MGNKAAKDKKALAGGGTSGSRARKWANTGFQPPVPKSNSGLDFQGRACNGKASKIADSPRDSGGLIQIRGRQVTRYACAPGLPWPLAGVCLSASGTVSRDLNLISSGKILFPSIFRGIIASGTQNENSTYSSPDPCRCWGSFLLNYSSLSVTGPSTIIRILVRGAISRSLDVICFGSLLEWGKARPNGDDPCQRNCQRLPNLVEKDGIFLLRLYGPHLPLVGTQGSRHLSLEKS